jgi:lysozyme family protein
MANVDIAMARLLHWEGKYVNDPLDPGGETNYGITQKSWTAFINNSPNMPASVKDISQDDAKVFYLLTYWRPLKCRLIDSQPMADALLSFAVNQGQGRAVKRLQKILGVTQDGIIGQNTIDAINSKNGNELCNQFCEETKNYFSNLIKKRPSLSKFANGWSNRANGYMVTA